MIKKLNQYLIYTGYTKCGRGKTSTRTFKMPSCLTKPADTNVAATPINAHNPPKAPMTDGFRPC